MGSQSKYLWRCTTMRNLARPRTLASVVVISLEKSGPGIGDTLCLELTPEFSKPAFCFALGMRGTFTTNIESVFQKKKKVESIKIYYYYLCYIPGKIAFQCSDVMDATISSTKSSGS
jgi:hypothetical protein